MRKEYESGKDMHLVSKDIDYNLLQHSRRMGKLRTYKSLRKRAGVPVRGQRTKSNFRRNKTLAAMKSKSGGKR
jgi:small subunit ribosomal protein S13